VFKAVVVASLQLIIDKTIQKSREVVMVLICIFKFYLVAKILKNRGFDY
jgi:hypothetical protein